MVSQKVVKKLENNLPIIARSGRIVLGRNYALWSLKNEADKVKTVVVSRNPPPDLLYELDQVIKRNKLSVPVVFSSKSNIELGELCGRPHSVSILAVYDFGSAVFREEDLNE